MRPPALALLALLLAPPLPASGLDPEARVGDLVLRVPPGWQRMDQDGATAFAAPPSVPGKATLLVLHAVPLKGSLRATFDGEWKALLDGYEVQQAFPVTAGQGPGGAELLATGAVLTDEKGVAWVGQLMGFQGAGRFQSLAFFSNDAPSSAFDRAVAALRGLLASVRIGGAGSQAAPPAPPRAAAQPGPAPAAEGPLGGVYRSVQGTSSSVDLTMTPRSITYRYATFFPDGVFVQSLPEGGLAGFDREGELRRNPVGWGRWELADGRGRVVFPRDAGSGQEQTVWKLEARSRDEVRIGAWAYRRLDPCDGLRLQGTYGRRDRNEFAPQTITFSPDGRFSDQGVLRAAGVLSRSFAPDDGVPGKGTYWIGSSTLRLTYDDGRVKRTFFALNDGASRGDPRVIELNTYAFDRR
jgi:hypothetical protein